MNLFCLLFEIYLEFKTASGFDAPDLQLDSEDDLHKNSSVCFRNLQIGVPPLITSAYNNTSPLLVHDLSGCGR